MTHAPAGRWRHSRGKAVPPRAGWGAFLAAGMAVATVVPCLAVATVVWGWAAGVAGAAESPIVLAGPLQEREVVFSAKALNAATVVSGTWKLQAGGDGCAAPLQWLVQTAQDPGTHVIVLPGAPLADVDIRVRFMPISGHEDAGGGIVFRFDRGRYYGVRVHALEGAVRLYAVDGQRRELASVRVRAPALGEWHTLRVVAEGDHVQSYLDGQLVLDHTDSAARGAGGVGLWTQADSVTAFDGLSIRGKPEPAVSLSR